MATTELPRTDPHTLNDILPMESPARPIPVQIVLGGLASLRLTVTLFGLLIFLVFAGTLAQVDHGIWYVVDHAYFRVWCAWIEFQAFARLVQMVYGAELNWPGGFFFPGGWTVGTAMALNLLAAHGMRFKVAAKGQRLWWGVATIGIGLISTYLIIRSGMDDALESELTPAFNRGLWHGLRAALAGLALTGGYLLSLNYGRWRRVEWWLAATISALLVAVAGWLYLNPQVRLDDSGLRIMWQLVKGSLAGGILLAGCVMVFKKRSGIVLLHGGIGLMMFSELLTGLTAREGNMTIFEGQTANYSYDIRAVELAVVDRSPVETDSVTVVPGALLKHPSAQPLSSDSLPFDVRVVRYMRNSRLRDPRAEEENLATAGVGRFAVAEEFEINAGVGSETVDTPSAYVELLDNDTGNPIGTYLVSTAGYEIIGTSGRPQQSYLPEETITIDGQNYDISLRFERTYRDHTLTLKDFEFKRYTATNKPKDFRSIVRLNDPQRNVDRDIPIWMNNPLRYAGETYYQSSFDDATEAATVLQVVSNPGWMIPYVSCMLVATGMLAHFGVMLARFIRRRAENAARIAAATAGSAAASIPGGRSSLAALWFPSMVLLLMVGYVGSKARIPEASFREANIHEFGKLPVAYQGRIQPFDTVARNMLQILCGRQEVIVPQDPPPRGLAKLFHRPEKLPAVRWLLDVIAGARDADQHRVFRIDNLELLDTLGLKRRPGSYRYSLAELRGKLVELDKQTELALKVEPDTQSLFQKKVLDLSRKLLNYGLLRDSFSSPQIRLEREHLLADMQRVQTKIQDLYDGVRDRREYSLVFAVPPTDTAGDWSFLLDAEFRVLHDRVMNREENPATVALSAMLDAYADDDALRFNKELTKYRGSLASYERSVEEEREAMLAAGTARAEILNQPKVNFEVFFNQFSPFFYAAVLYLLAFILAALSWLGWSVPLNRAANWLLQFTFALHTFALIGRIYISGRPPVTNLYSSAVFIGWACVLIGLVIEALYRMGIGNIVAAVTGFLTLVIAYNLSLDGDTFLVLQAVLDTQFWLATHVVCITLGYATTLLAGVLGVVYILGGTMLSNFEPQQRQQLTRMIYGTLCFAIFFSFVGTVLGGLWADDSWGRFWGWDPKENGALIIVLWNALVLHARWGALVGPRGLAALAVGGNIVTSWSWFGVNELGVGLHSYGFSEGRAMWLFLFVLSQLAVIGLAYLPLPLRFSRAT